tara:strand:- start:537 stop:1910 length:1374 start_codon:yes stop_codon:yes gene_type:complete
MSKKDCHNGNPLVFKTKGISVYAGGTNRDGGWHKMQPIPQLAMGPIGVIRSAKTIDILPDGWSSSSVVIGGSTPVVIEIDWPDYGIPNNLQGNWWKALVMDIKEKNITTISTQCMGGHGRTGVQLAILAHLLIPESEHEWKDVEQLVTWIRTKFCSHAVESKSQQTYISEVCGIPEGESVISVQSNPWATTDFDASAMFTEDEIKQAASNRKRQDEKRAEWDNRPKHAGSQFKGKTEIKYQSPIKKGWSLTGCDDCGNYEWRKTNKVDMNWPCRKCGSSKVVPKDIELMDGINLVICHETNEHWHPCEMYTDNRSLKAEIIQRGMRIRELSNGFYEVIIGSSWWPHYFLGEDSTGDIVPVHRIYNAMRKKEKAISPNQRKITDKFNDKPPDWPSSTDTKLWDEMRSANESLEKLESALNDGTDKLKNHTGKIQDKLDQYSKTLERKRKTNEEIEAED